MKLQKAPLPEFKCDTTLPNAESLGEFLTGLELRKNRFYIHSRPQDHYILIPICLLR